MWLLVLKANVSSKGIQQMLCFFKGVTAVTAVSHLS